MILGRAFVTPEVRIDPLHDIRPRAPQPQAPHEYEPPRVAHVHVEFVNNVIISRAGVPIVFVPDIPSHTDESVSMLQADIESTRTERHHAQLHSDASQSGEWFQEYIDNNTEPCGPRNLTLCLPCWRAEVSDARGRSHCDHRHFRTINGADASLGCDPP